MILFQPSYAQKAPDKAMTIAEINDQSCGMALAPFDKMMSQTRNFNDQTNVHKSDTTSPLSSLLSSLPKDDGSTTLVTTKTTDVVAKATASASVLSYEVGSDLFAEQETCQEIDLSPQSSLSRRHLERQEEVSRSVRQRQA